MKSLFILLSLVLATSAFAETRAAGNGLTLGVPNGLYAGSGVLQSESLLVPNLKFESVRRLQDGTIQARTQAKLFGHVVAEASALLKIRAVDSQNFELLDLENGGAVSGTGFCGVAFCSFTATVMNGALELNETWATTATGFRIVEGSQNFRGIRSTYTGTFSTTNP